MAPEARASKLYIVTEAALAPASLAAVLDATGAEVMLIGPAAGATLDAASARPLLACAQAKGVAALIAADAALARTLRADGVHLPWDKDIVERYGEAREILGRRFIVGADAGRSRHDAMVLGEAEADYVAFGVPPHVEDRETAAARRLELVAWWSEIFNVPGVAFDVETAQEAAALAAAGADFVALTVPAKLSADELGRWGEEVARAMNLPEAAA